MKMGDENVGNKRIAFNEKYIDSLLLKNCSIGQDNAFFYKMAKKAIGGVIQNDLTDHQRDFILLHYYENLSMTEIAQKYGLNISTVSRTIRRAHEKILNRLKYYFIQ